MSDEENLLTIGTEIELVIYNDRGMRMSEFFPSKIAGKNYSEYIVTRPCNLP